MATAYVLINCELGSEESIIQQLKSLDHIKEVFGTLGAYDILAKVESSTVIFSLLADKTCGTSNFKARTDKWVLPKAL